MQAKAKKISDIIAWGLVVFLLFGCKTADWHYNKALDKGFVPEKTSVHDTIITTITINGKDSLIEVPVTVPCPDPKPKPSRAEVRFDWKKHKDSLRYDSKKYSDSLDHVIDVLNKRNKLLSDSLDAVVKINRQDNRLQKAESKATWWKRTFGELWWFLLLIGFASGWFLRKTLIK